MPTLTVHRPKRFRDVLRAYQICVDGTLAAEIRSGGSVTIEITPGHHEVVAKIDWCSSPPVDVDSSSRDISLEVGPTVGTLHFAEMVSRITARRREYLYLREA